jgi:Flp pilus assembly protein TadD
LASDAGVERERILKLAKRAAEKKPVTAASLTAQGAALLRAGKADAALARLNQAAELDGKGGTPMNALFLALAHQRLGHENEARRWLARARQLNEMAPRALLNGTVAPAAPWYQQIEMEILRSKMEGMKTDK